MSPLNRFYWALLGFVATLVVGHTILFLIADRPEIVVAEVCIATAFGVYLRYFVRCPRCRKRLSQRWTVLFNALPGKKCPACGYDLSQPANSEAREDELLREGEAALRKGRFHDDRAGEAKQRLAGRLIVKALGWSRDP